MNAEAWTAVVAIAVGVLSALLAALWGMLVLKVRDLEERAVSREIFKMHSDHVDNRLDKQDQALAVTMQKTDRALGILESLDKARRSMYPSRHDG